MGNPAFKLQDSGFSREQVDALSEWVDGTAATKVDLLHAKGELKEDIAALRGELKEDIAGLRGEMETGLAGLRGDLETGLAGLRGELKADILVMRWILGGLVAGVGTLILHAFFLAPGAGV